MSLRNKEVFGKGDRVKHRGNGLEGTVEAISNGARRRIVWDDSRVTLTHIGDLLELVD